MAPAAARKAAEYLNCVRYTIDEESFVDLMTTVGKEIGPDRYNEIVPLL